MGQSIYNTYEDRQRWAFLTRLQATKEINQRYAHIQPCDEKEDEARAGGDRPPEGERDGKR